MTQPPLSLAILFASLRGSTWLYDMLGERAAQAKIKQCLTLLDSIAQRHGGGIVKTVGDETLCSFPTAANAVEAAIAMQQGMAAIAASDKDALHIRIGLHFGAAIRAGNDISGDAVNMAARMTGQAAADQIITPRQTAESLPPELRANICYLGLTAVKGSGEDIQICEVSWKAEAVMTMMPSLPGMTKTARTASLTLSYAGRQLTLTSQDPTTTVGRDPACGLVVDDPMASRNHARIELRGGKFILIDQSTNGTYLNQDGKTHFLHRAEIPLMGRGNFSLGHETSTDAPQAVQYSCEY